MKSVDNTKSRIRNIVTMYKNEFSQEYKDACEYISEKRRLNHDDFGGTRGEHNIKRKLVELPETLWSMFHQGLNGEELEWLYESPNQKWFAKTYPEFKGGNVI